MTGLPPVRQSREGLNGKLVTIVVFATAIATALAAIIAAALLARFRGRMQGAPAPYPVATAIAAIHQTPIAGPADADALAAQARKRLQEYRMLAKDRSIAAIPIERAMDWLSDDARNGRLLSLDPATIPDAGAADGVRR
jgi:hypothetical protein